MTFAQFLALLTTIGAVALVVINLVRPYVKDVRLAKGLEILEKLAAAAVGSRLQRVQDLKDPTKPGYWSPAAALSTKQSAVDDVVITAFNVVQGLKTLGVERPEHLIAQMIESEVMTRKASQTSSTAAVAVVTPDPASVVPVEGSEP